MKTRTLVVRVLVEEEEDGNVTCLGAATMLRSVADDLEAFNDAVPEGGRVWNGVEVCSWYLLPESTGIEP